MTSQSLANSQALAAQPGPNIHPRPQPQCLMDVSLDIGESSLYTLWKVSRKNPDFKFLPADLRYKLDHTTKEQVTRFELYAKKQELMADRDLLQRFMEPLRENQAEQIMDKKENDEFGCRYINFRHGSWDMENLDLVQGVSDKQAQGRMSRLYRSSSLSANGSLPTAALLNLANICSLTSASVQRRLQQIPSNLHHGHFDILRPGYIQLDFIALSLPHQPMPPFPLTIPSPAPLQRLRDVVLKPDEIRLYVEWKLHRDIPGLFALIGWHDQLSQLARMPKEQVTKFELYTQKSDIERAWGRLAEWKKALAEARAVLETAKGDNDEFDWMYVSSRGGEVVTTGRKVMERLIEEGNAALR